MRIFKVARFDSFTEGANSYAFYGPQDAVVALQPDEIIPLLDAVESAVAAGLHAVGYLSYEAASGLDPRLVGHAPGELPLAHFVFYREKVSIAAGEGLSESVENSLGWRASVERSAYGEALDAIRTHLAAGDSYQVNYTFRLRTSFSGDPTVLYAALGRAQRAPFAALLDDGQHALISASPELFFRLRNGSLETRPMKGTRRRGRWAEEDLELADQLRQSAKERAENVMITDMLRNDLGRISEVGSVAVPVLFSAERYPTLWQLTSTVSSRLRSDVSLVDLFAALFPCASVTGAPKVRTMEIIRDVESGPRGIYTGCMGYLSPGMEACFNVAIRTAHLDRERGTLEYGVGGGITWDSSAQSEYDECLVKAQVLSMRRPAFELLETMLWDGRSYYLLQRHLKRLADSAVYWGMCCDRKQIIARLEHESKSFGHKQMRVRLLVDEDGGIKVAAVPLSPVAEGLMRAHLAPGVVDSADPFLYHKTTQRTVYERAAAAVPSGEEALLVNERGELTEFCIGNLVVERGGRRYTPPVECGLLPGTLRAELLARGEIEERIMHIDDLNSADRIFLINSVRGYVPIEVISGGSVCIA